MQELPTPETGGPLVALWTALGALALAAAEYLRRKLRNGKPRAPTQLDRIEEMLKVLTRVLVVEIEGGGKVSVSRGLAEKIEARLTGIENRLARRGGQIDALARNTESLSEAVQSGMDLIGERIGRLEKRSGGG